MKYILQENFILTEAMKDSPSIPKKGDKVDWRAVFNTQHPINQSGDEYEKLSSTALWDRFFTDEEFVVTGITESGAGAYCKKLGEAFKIEVLEYGFDITVNPFLAYLKNTVFKDASGFARLENCYSGLHNALVKHLIVEGNLTGNKHDWETDLIHNTTLFDNNSSYIASDVFDLLKFLTDTVVKPFKSGMLSFKNANFVSKVKQAEHVVGILAASSAPIVDVPNPPTPDLASDKINNITTIKERFRQLFEEDGTAEKKNVTDDLDEISADISRVLNRIDSSYKDIKKDNQALRALLTFAAERRAKTGSELTTMLNKINGAFSGTAITDPVKLQPIKLGLLDMKFEITKKNIEAVCAKINP